MARRKQAPPEPADLDPVGRNGELIAPRDLLDPRALLMAPEAIQGDAAGLAWAEEHAPSLVLTVEDVNAHRARSARLAAWREGRRDARRRGHPAPELGDFLELAT